jgi:hypothetical protein
VTALKSTKFFFDRQPVIDAIGKQAVAALGRFGAYVQRRAKTSIKKATGKQQTSSLGQPPRSHTGNLRKFIYFAYSPQTKSVVIGPELFTAASSAGQAPATLEYSGRIRPHKNPRRRLRTVGSSGEIKLGGHGVTTKKTRDWRGMTQRVTYGKLRTAAQAQRANFLNRVLYGPDKIGGNVAARPFMGPAFEAELNDLPSIWRQSVTTR